MRVQEQVVLKDKEKKYVSPFTLNDVTCRTANDITGTNSHQNDLYEGKICENTHLLADSITTKD